MAEYTSKGQSNYGWSLTWDAAGRYPIIAKRRFETLADAQNFVNDTSSTATATEGLIISVFNDTAKNNGVYWVEYVANNDQSYGEIHNTGKLVKVGGNDTETANNYSAAVELSNTLNVGQIIKVTNDQTITTGEGETAVTQTYKSGFYIVNGVGSISSLSTSTGASDEIGALASKVTALETSTVKTTDYDLYKTEINAVLAGKATSGELATHTGNQTVHITDAERVLWNNSYSTAKQHVTEEIAKLSSIYQTIEAAGTSYNGLVSYITNNFDSKGSGVNAYNLAVSYVIEYADIKGSASAVNLKLNAHIGDASHLAEGERERWDDAADAIEAFLKEAITDSDSKNVIDTLKELQELMGSDDELSTGLLKRISDLEEASDDYISADETNLTYSYNYTDQQIGNLSNTYALKSETYTTTEVDAAIAQAKKDAQELINNLDVYTKEEVYSKEETYSKEEVYTKDETYSKEEVYNKEETYNKTEIDNNDNLVKAYNKAYVDELYTSITFGTTSDIDAIFTKYQTS